jgi:predicted transcriptional regulator
LGAFGGDFAVKRNKRKSKFERTVPGLYEEDAATLKAIDEGLRDAKKGRTVSMAQVRKLLSKWIANSASRKDR